jgi:hypothetical protein
MELLLASLCRPSLPTMLNEQKNYIPSQWTSQGTTLTISILMSFEKEYRYDSFEMTGPKYEILKKVDIVLG